MPVPPSRKRTLAVARALDDGGGRTEPRHLCGGLALRTPSVGRKYLAFGASFVGNESPAEQETVAPPGVGSGASVSVGAVSIRSCHARADAG